MLSIRLRFADREGDPGGGGGAGAAATIVVEAVAEDEEEPSLRADDVPADSSPSGCVSSRTALAPREAAEVELSRREPLSEVEFSLLRGAPEAAEEPSIADIAAFSIGSVSMAS